MSGERVLPPGPEELSCYTANLAVYLGDGALGRIARSVRLAVQTDLGDDLLAFSHHRTPVDDGRLGYKGTDDAETALEAIAAEVERAGACLVVANTGYLDWSTAGPDGQAPHLLLVDGRRGEEWHVVDRFRALLPSNGGEQRPFAGWISSAALTRGLTPIVPLPPEQRLRNRLAFGFPRPLPEDGHYQWLERTEHGAADRLEGAWLTDAGAALDYLGEFWAGLDRRPERRRLLDDMWAAAQHHAFRYGYLLATTEERPVLEEARRGWRDLPMALRFAVDSAQRGRHRPTLVTRTFAALRRVESEAASLLEEGEQAWTHASPMPSGIAL
jgi:hypothetical protein